MWGVLPWDANRIPPLGWLSLSAPGGGGADVYTLGPSADRVQAPPEGALVRTFVQVAVTGVTDHFSEILVLSPRGLEIKHEVLHAQPQVIKRLLQLRNGLAHPHVALFRLISELLESFPLPFREGVDLLEQIIKLALEILLFHIRTRLPSVVVS